MLNKKIFVKSKNSSKTVIFFNFKRHYIMHNCEYENLKRVIRIFKILKLNKYFGFQTKQIKINNSTVPNIVNEIFYRKFESIKYGILSLGEFLKECIISVIITNSPEKGFLKR